MSRPRLRSIPSVDKILHALGEVELPHAIVVDMVRRELAALRKAKTATGLAGLLPRLHSLLNELRASRIQPVINGTGILIHTNLGRAPLGAEVIENLSKIGSLYSNLEYTLGAGSRGVRGAYLERALALLCAAEAATVVNNNAAALILILKHFCKTAGASGDRPNRKPVRQGEFPKNDVVISRGELIQIGGGFRIPEILEVSGARLCEVGTTNKTSLKDYARAITRDTALILKVHRSNFYMSGFVESPRVEEIAELARKQRVPFVEDLGSGAIVATESIAGLKHEPTPAEAIRRGVDLVCFSGDKLFGGPQAGVIAGRLPLVAALKRDPLFRALRCDKLILSALETTVELYFRKSDPSQWKPEGDKRLKCSDGSGLAGIPVLRMLTVSNEELRTRGDRIVSTLKDLPLRVVVGTGAAQVGGGTLPRATLPSVTIDLAHSRLSPQEVAARLRAYSVPIIGYVERGKLKLDLRTIFQNQDEDVVKAIRALPS